MSEILAILLMVLAFIIVSILEYSIFAGLSVLINNVFGKGEDKNLIFAIGGTILFASFFSIIWCMFFPNQIVSYTIYPGVSLIISPLVMAFIMMKVNTFLTKRGNKVSFIISFWGGATLGFTFSIVRLFCLGII